GVHLAGRSLAGVNWYRFLRLASRRRPPQAIGRATGPPAIGESSMIKRTPRRGFLALALLVLVLAWPAARAAAADAVSYKLVLETRQGTAVNDGTVQVVGNHFSITGLMFFRRYDLSGEINGNYIKVTGDWDGNYVGGDGQVANGAAQLDLRPTGIVYSAFI